jgi:hypothetical protein
MVPGSYPAFEIDYKRCVRQEIDDLGHLAVETDHRLLGAFPVRDIPDGLDRPDDISLGIIDRARFRPEEYSAGSEVLDVNIHNERITDPLDSVIPFLDLDLGHEDKVGQHRFLDTVERDRILVFPFPEHRFGRYSGHFLHRMVPGGYPAFEIDYKCGIR